MKAKMTKTAKTKTAVVNPAWTVGDAAVGHIVQCALDAVAVSYTGGDAMSPGLVLSRLPDGRYYASVARYPRWHGEKVVAYKATEGTLHEALRKAMGAFLEAQGALQRLRAAL